MNLMDIFSSADEGREASEQRADLDSQEPSTIYHLKTTRRYINDVSLIGPTARFTEILHLIEQNMRQYGSYRGLDGLHDLKTSLIFGARSLHSFNAPLPDGNIMKFDIIREDNAEVRRVLNQVRTYTAHCITPLAVQSGTIAGTNGGAQTKDIKIFRTFTSKDGALNCAGSKFTELQADHEDCIAVHVQCHLLTTAWVLSLVSLTGHQWQGRSIFRWS
jgi:hypothetical protein